MKGDDIMNNNIIRPFDDVKMVAVKKGTLVENGCVNNCGSRKFQLIEENVYRCTECGKNYIVLPNAFISALIHESEINMGVYSESKKYGTEIKKNVNVKSRTLKPNNYHSTK